MAEESDSGYGQQDPADQASDFAARDFHIQQRLARVRTMVLVKVTAIKGGAGAIAAPGTVTVQPLVKMLDGQGNATSHGTINNVPVFRQGGGKNVVICDPIVGDIGWMAVSDRDISAVKSSKGEANPGSNRKFDLADGVYMGSLFGDTPEQYITFTSTGVKIADKNGNVLEMKAGGNFFTGNVFINGGLNLSGVIKGLDGTTEYAGDIKTSGVIQSGSIVLGTHRHDGVVVGGADSGGPIP